MSYFVVQYQGQNKSNNSNTPSLFFQCPFIMTNISWDNNKIIVRTRKSYKY